MKLFRIVFCVAVFAAMGAAMAQTKQGDVVVDVPFAFSVAGQKLPAGHYIVTTAGTDLVRIFNPETRGLFVPTHSGMRSKSDGSKLVFHRYRDTYFLSSVWMTGNTFGKELFRSPAERELEAQQAEMELAVVRPAK
jgi:hypothetical protein